MSPLSMLGTQSLGIHSNSAFMKALGAAGIAAADFSLACFDTSVYNPVGKGPP